MEKTEPVVRTEEGTASEPLSTVAETLELKAEITLRDLLDAGVHFGHQTKRWNPKMRPYIFDKRNGIHLIDLTQTLVRLKAAQEFLARRVGEGKAVLFVGTKKQAQTTAAEVARLCGQFYVTNRWLGGTLTNNRTIRKSVQRMRQIEKMERDGLFEQMPKKEVATLRRELVKLQKNLCGIADMEEMPGALVVIDVKREANAVKEANTLGIPVVAVVDTCCDPDPVDLVIPGNDDAIRAIRVILSALGAAIKQAREEFDRRASEIRKEESAEGATREVVPAPAATVGSEEGGRRRRPSGRATGRNGGRSAGGRALRREAGSAEGEAASSSTPSV